MDDEATTEELTAMTDRLLGFQVVLLDEQGQEICRIPDVYYENKSILVEDVHFREQDVKMESGQQVRYFKRARLARAGASCCGPYD